MKLGYDRPLYLVAFDHRSSFSKGLETIGEIADRYLRMIRAYVEYAGRGPNEGRRE